MSFAAYILKKINHVPEESVPQDVAQPSQRLIRITKKWKTRWSKSGTREAKNPETQIT